MHYYIRTYSYKNNNFFKLEHYKTRNAYKFIQEYMHHLAYTSFKQPKKIKILNKTEGIIKFCVLKNSYK